MGCHEPGGILLFSILNISGGLVKTFNKKIILRGVFRILLYFFLLESLLQWGGKALFSLQDFQNKLNTREGDYRILCLGDSVTAWGGEDSYPNQLEEILHSTQNNVKVRVINRGVWGATQKDVISYLEKYVNEYKPHIVTVMIGLGEPHPNINKLKSKVSGSHLFERSRIYQLTQVFWNYIIHKNNEIKIAQEYQDNLFEQDFDFDLKGHLEHFKVCLAHDPPFQGYRNFKRLAGSYLDIYQRGLEYMDSEQFEHAAEMFRGLLKLPSHFYLEDARVEAYDRLGELGGFYFEQKKYEKAETLLKQYIDSKPHSRIYSPRAHLQLIDCYRMKGRLKAAEKVSEQGALLNSDSGLLQAERISFFMERKEYEKAEKTAKRFLDLKLADFPNKDMYRQYFYKQLLTSYELQGKADKAGQLRKAYYMRAEGNYRRIMDVISQAKIQLIVVQYPMRETEFIEKKLYASNDIFFVDNKEIFEAIDIRRHYYEYFIDRTGRDFGHCTAKGNQLIAKNIARTIRKEIFKLVN